MARRKSQQNGPGLFHEQELRAARLTRPIRRQRALFIPYMLRGESSMPGLRGTAQDRAYELAVKWADLEAQGHLADYRETSVDTQFLDQLFGEGLGYRVKTVSPDAWQLEHKFSVPGVGIADGALGDFSPHAHAPTAIIELKDGSVDLDRDRSNGRTAVQQCWDYLNAC